MTNTANEMTSPEFLEAAQKIAAHLGLKVTIYGPESEKARAAGVSGEKLRSLGVVGFVEWDEDTDDEAAATFMARLSGVTVEEARALLRAPEDKAPDHPERT
jgi:hypothetical protein